MWRSLALLLAAGCASGTSDERRDRQLAGARAGRDLFESYCAACHQHDDQGVGEAPPLAQSPWVAGPEERLVKIVLHGVRGRLEVLGEIYDREMPGFGTVLSDDEVASLLSFVRARYGSPSEPIAPEVVARIRGMNRDRTGYWSVEELLAE